MLEEFCVGHMKHLQQELRMPIVYLQQLHMTSLTCTPNCPASVHGKLLWKYLMWTTLMI